MYAQANQSHNKKIKSFAVLTGEKGDATLYRLCALITRRINRLVCSASIQVFRA